MADGLIHVVRHAHAGDRAGWPVDDDLRPLTPRGAEQALRLRAHLGGDVAAVYASPSLRCVATVLPLARAAGLELSTRAELYEGHGARPLLDLISRQATFPVVACTHGDVVADLLGILIDSGLRLPGTRAEKASTWTLVLSGGRISSARYVPPP